MLEINKIYNEDCLEGMKRINDKSIDCIITDLPYGVTQNKADIILPFKPLWEQYERIIKDNGAIILFGQGLFFVDLVNSNRKLFRYDLIWNKCLTSGFLNAKRMPLRQHEQIAVFYKKTPIYNPQFTEGKPTHSKGTKFLDKNQVNNNYGKFTPVDKTSGETRKYPTSILKFQKPHPSVALHRTEKSIPLLEWLIKTYTNSGDVVLDSCAGSMTLAFAAINTKRNYICFEKDREIFNKGSQRVKEHLAQ